MVEIQYIVKRDEATHLEVWYAISQHLIAEGKMKKREEFFQCTLSGKEVVILALREKLGHQGTLADA
jgi:hypothetical protein